jgi:hypothetical protein
LAAADFRGIANAPALDFQKLGQLYNLLNRKVEPQLGAKTLDLSNRIVEPVFITHVGMSA